MPGIARVLIILTLLATAMFLAVLVMSDLRTGVVHAEAGKATDNVTASTCRNKIDPRLERLINTEESQSYVIVKVYIKMEGQQFNDRQASAIQAIEALALPYAYVRCAGFDDNFLFLIVYTQIGSIEALANIPGVVCIDVINLGIPVSPYYSPLPFYPCRGSNGWPVNQPSFAWKAFKETTKYKFVLAKDRDMAQIIKEVEIPAISYVYDGTLDYGTTYFWRVMALEPLISDWTLTFSFQTETAPSPPPPEPQPQPAQWPPALIAGLIIALTTAIGLTTWFLVARSHRTRRVL